MSACVDAVVQIAELIGYRLNALLHPFFRQCLFFWFQFFYYLSVFSLRALDEAGYQSTRAT